MSKVIDNIEDIASIDSKVDKITSTNNAIVRFDGTNGEVQDSGAYITDTGNLLVGTTTNNGVDKLQVNGSIIASNFQQGTFTPTFWNSDPDTINYNNTISNSYGTWKIVGKEVEISVRILLTNPCQASKTYMALRLNSPVSISGVNTNNSYSVINVTAGTHPNYYTYSGCAAGVDTAYRGLDGVIFNSATLNEKSNVSICATIKFQLP